MCIAQVFDRVIIHPSDTRHTNKEKTNANDNTSSSKHDQALVDRK